MTACAIWQMAAGGRRRGVAQVRSVGLERRFERTYDLGCCAAVTSDDQPVRAVKRAWQSMSNTMMWPQASSRYVSSLLSRVDGEAGRVVANGLDHHDRAGGPLSRADPSFRMSSGRSVAFQYG